MLLNYDTISFYQRFWMDSSNIPIDRKNDLLMLSNKLIESAKKNNDSIDDIILLYPEDCPNFDSFVMFANVVYAYVSIREHGGAKMHGFGLNNQVEVE